MKDAPADPPLFAAPGRPILPRGKLMFWIALALATHLAALMVFSSKRPLQPRAVTNVPHLRLLDSANELVALSDPTLFAQPHANDFASAYWQRTPTIVLPRFHWTEPAGELPAPTVDELGAALQRFVQTNWPAATELNFKLAPQLSEVTVALANDLPAHSTLQITGELAKRRRLDQPELSSVRLNDVLPAGTVQVLADQSGNVISAVLLESSSNEEADRLALQLASQLRFAPAASPTLGEIIFHWHTVPANTP